MPAGAQAGDLVGAKSCTYEVGRFKYVADCGTLIVPENRGDPGSRLIALPVTRVRATGSDPAEPILKLGGGPGKSNMATGIVPWFIENHDVVLVGYRGVDGTVRLSCPEVSEVIKDLPGDMLGDAALDALHAAYARWRRHFDTDQNRHSEKLYRITNEVPTVLMIGIVILVIVKPF